MKGGWKMKYWFVVNPNSRSGVGKMVWDRIEPELLKQNVDYECVQTQYRGHAMKIVAQITADDEEHQIVVVGGDGTVNEVVNGIRDVTKVILGYIPTGSSNDFARGLQLPKKPLEALEVVLHPGKIEKMDIGLLTRQGKARRFAVSTGFGFDAVICHEVAISKLKRVLNRIKLGKLIYVSVALRRLFHDKPVHAEIVYDDQPVRIYENVYFVTAMNNLYEGGGFLFCPEGKKDDGYLDVIVVSGLPKLGLLCLLPLAYKGWHVHFPGIDIVRCKRVSMCADQLMPIHMDGEPLYLKKEVTAELLPDQIRVMVR
jgi:YegS/Rv2252/BmrU family lipid kinase